MAQMFAVVLRASGEVVSFGDTIQDDTHCICSHSEHQTGVETVTEEGGATRERPLGCPVKGCWHSYETMTEGLIVRRSWREGMAEITEPQTLYPREGADPVVIRDSGKVGPVLWVDPDGKADCAFVSDPLPADLEAIPIDHIPGAGERWDPLTRAVVPVSSQELIATLEAQLAAIQEAIAKAQQAEV